VIHEFNIYKVCAFNIALPSSFVGDHSGGSGWLVVVKYERPQVLSHDLTRGSIEFDQFLKEGHCSDSILVDHALLHLHVM
jgi:hypothetical protein